MMTFKKKLWKHMKLSEHVTILESPQDRVYYTRHGLHFNGYGSNCTLHSRSCHCAIDNYQR
jgi:hypothetical protein